MVVSSVVVSGVVVIVGVVIVNDCVVVATVGACMRYRVTGLAAEAAFFALLSLPPLIFALVGSIGYVLENFSDARSAEIRAAVAAGAEAVKIFPAASAGGPGHVKALRAVFPGLPFCPTGGVDASNAPDYLDAGADFVGMGGKLVDEKRIAAGDKAAILRAARDALGLMEA